MKRFSRAELKKLFVFSAFAALTFILATPQTVLAKTIERSGTISSKKRGDGTWVETITTGNPRTNNTVWTFDSGEVITMVRSLTDNPDGSQTGDTSLAYTGDGYDHSTTMDLTLTPTGNPGNYTISGTWSNTAGTVYPVTGTKYKLSSEIDTDLAFTNPKGEVRYHDDVQTVEGDEIINQITEIGFNGKETTHTVIRRVNNNGGVPVLEEDGDSLL
jgi:hypothetical protein